jgi:SRSO17 transposase
VILCIDDISFLELASSLSFGFVRRATPMTTDELRAAADELFVLHGRFGHLFGRVEARKHSLVYLQGLLSAQGRKSVEPMALVFGDGSDSEPADGNTVINMQRFITASPWEWSPVQREIQTVFTEQLATSAADWPIGTVGIIDESSFIKKGTESVGVARQYCGRTGTVENCQVGVFLVGTVPAGSALLDHELYLTKTWIADRKRRKKTRVPKTLKFRTKPKIALQLLQRNLAGPVRFDWIIADEEYGRNGDFLDGLEAMSQRYVVEVPVNTTVWTVDPEGSGRPPGKRWREHVRTVRRIGENLPEDAWKNLQLREGASGPLVFQFARVRVWAVRHRKPGPAVWLLIKRSLGDKPETKYYLVNAPAEEPLETMALVTGTRWRVEEFLEEGKGYLGMGHYEARSWTSWHHHMSLVGLAHLFVTLTRQRLKKNSRADTGYGGEIAEDCSQAA